MTAQIRDKFAVTRDELCSSLIERESEIDVVLTALLCHEHVLLVGPPGTAKSMLSDGIVTWLDGKRFSIQIGKFSTPEELFGPLSLQGLKNDEYRRVVKDKLPEAHVAFIDEIFKASSAILNTMLQVLNERTYLNDGVLLQCPLKLCVAASNEWPGDQEGGKELGALFDRFLFRKTVKPIASAKSIDKLLWSADLVPKLSTRITPAELDLASAEAAQLPWTESAKEALLTIRRESRNEGILTGDRRLRKAVKACQAFAWLEGAVAVEPDHLEVLSHCLWEDPQEQPEKLAEVVGKVANPAAMKVNSLLMEVEQLTSKLDMKDIAAVGVSVKKLGEIHAELKKISGAKAVQAAEFVSEKAVEIKKATVQGLGSF